MPHRIQAVIGTVMTLVLMVHLWLDANFHAMASAKADPASGRVFSWPWFSRSHRTTFVTHDQYWALAITGGVFLACMIALMLAPRGYRELGED
jgi:hypothetical protein